MAEQGNEWAGIAARSKAAEASAEYPFFFYDRKNLAAACAENPLLSEPGAEPGFATIATTDDLVRALRAWQWARGTGFVRGDLAFVEQAADEWAVYSRSEDGGWSQFESMSFVRGGQTEAETRRTLNALEIATHGERTSLRWNVFDTGSIVHGEMMQGVEMEPWSSLDPATQDLFDEIVNEGRVYAESTDPLCKRLAEQFDRGEYDAREAVSGFEGIVRDYAGPGRSEEAVHEVACRLLDRYSGRGGAIAAYVEEASKTAGRALRWEDQGISMDLAWSGEIKPCRTMYAESGTVEAAVYERPSYPGWAVIVEEGHLETRRIVEHLDAPDLPKALYLAEKIVERTVQQVRDGEAASGFDYQLLHRLKQDCDYYLGAGGRAEKNLWSGSAAGQIAKMREIYKALPAKPEWLTAEDIDAYERQMGAGGRSEEPVYVCQLGALEQAGLRETLEGLGLAPQDVERAMDGKVSDLEDTVEIDPAAWRELAESRADRLPDAEKRLAALAEMGVDEDCCFVRIERDEHGRAKSVDALYFNPQSSGGGSFERVVADARDAYDYLKDRPEESLYSLPMSIAGKYWHDVDDPAWDDAVELITDERHGYERMEGDETPAVMALLQGAAGEPGERAEAASAAAIDAERTALERGINDCYDFGDYALAAEYERGLAAIEAAAAGTAERGTETTGKEKGPEMNENEKAARPHDSGAKAAKGTEKVFLRMHESFVKENLPGRDYSTGEPKPFNKATMPKGTMVGGKDVGGYSFTPFYVNGDRFNGHMRTIPYPADKEIHLSRAVGTRNESGEWVPALDDGGKQVYDRVAVDPAELKAALVEQRKAYAAEHAEISHQDRRMDAPTPKQAADQAKASAAARNAQSPKAPERMPTRGK